MFSFLVVIVTINIFRFLKVIYVQIKIDLGMNFFQYKNLSMFKLSSL